MVYIVRLKLELCVTSLWSTLQYFMALASTESVTVLVLKTEKGHRHVPPCPYGFMDAPWEVSALTTCPKTCIF